METQPLQRNPPAFQVSLYDEGDGVGTTQLIKDEIREVFVVDIGIWR